MSAIVWQFEHSLALPFFGIELETEIFQFVIIHTVKAFGVVNKAEVDVFLELSCFVDDPTDIGSLISGFSAFLRLLIFLPGSLIPAHASSSPAFLIMYSAYKLNKQGDNIQS